MSTPEQFLAETKQRCQHCDEGEYCEFCGSTGWVTIDPCKDIDTTPMSKGVTPELRAMFSTVAANLDRNEASGHELTEAQVSPAEMWLAAAMNRAEVEYEQQYPVGPFFLDFYFPDCKLAVEVDGAAYHTDAAKDARRTAYLLEHGVRQVLRFPAMRVRDDAGRILEEIAAAREALA